MRPGSIATLAAAAALAGACSFHFRNDGWNVFGDLAHATKEASEPLDLAAGGTLRIETVSGDVRVRVDPAAAPRVDAKMTGSAKEEAEAHALLERTSLAVEKVGGERPALRVGVQSSEPTVADGNALYLQVQVDLALVVPADVTIRIATRYGDVAVDGPVRAVTIDAAHGDVRVVDATEARVTTRSGKIDLERIRGPIEVASEYDSIEVVDVEGPTLHVRTRSGGVRLRNARADRIDLESSYGDVALDRVAPLRHEVEVTATTSSGDVTARDVAGTLEASNRSGTIRISGFQGDLRALSEYGDVEIDGELGKLDAETRSGRARVVARSGSRVATPWRIETRYGDVQLDLPHDLDAEVEAATTYGRITGDFDVRISGGPDHARATAKLGAGGRTIRVATSNGDVRVLRR